MYIYPVRQRLSLLTTLTHAEFYPSKHCIGETAVLGVLAAAASRAHILAQPFILTCHLSHRSGAKFVSKLVDMFISINFSPSACEGLMASMGDETSSREKSGAKFVLNELIPGSTPTQPIFFLPQRTEKTSKESRCQTTPGCFADHKHGLYIFLQGISHNPSSPT